MPDSRRGNAVVKYTSQFIMESPKNKQQQTMIVRKLRLKRGWSQDHLAHLTGLNVRTIQRIEQGQTPSLESRKSLAAVFEVDIATFEPMLKEPLKDPLLPYSGESIMNESNTKTEVLEHDEKHAIEYAKGVKEFLTHLLMYLIFLPFILLAKGYDKPALIWVLAGWGVGVIFHGLYAFEKLNFFKTDWERKIAEKKLGRKL